MALDDIFEWRGQFHHDNGQIANLTQHYKCVNIGSSAGNAEHLNDVVRNALESILPGGMHPIWTGGMTVAQNLTNQDDRDEGSFDFTPGLTGNPLPSFLCVGIRSPYTKFGFNRGRHNPPLLDASFIDANGTISESGREYLELWCSFFGNNATAASTGEQWTPITVEKVYENKVLVEVNERASLLGLWQYNVNFTTEKSRQQYFWDDID